MKSAVTLEMLAEHLLSVPTTCSDLLPKVACLGDRSIQAGMMIASSGGCDGLFLLRFFLHFLLKLTFLGLLIEGAEGTEGIGFVMMMMQIKHDLVLRPFGPGPLLLIFLQVPILPLHQCERCSKVLDAIASIIFCEIMWTVSQK